MLLFLSLQFTFGLTEFCKRYRFLNSLSSAEIGLVKNKFSKHCSIYHSNAVEDYITAEIRFQSEYIAVDGDTDNKHRTKTIVKVFEE